MNKSLRKHDARSNGLLEVDELASFFSTAWAEYLDRRAAANLADEAA